MAACGAPNAVHPEEGEAGEEACAAEVKAGDRLLDAVPVRHYVQAPVVRHVALRGNSCFLLKFHLARFELAS